MSDQSTLATEESATYSPLRWLALAVMLLAVLMDMVDATVVNVALPAIRDDLGASSSQLEWSIAGYTLAFAAIMITGGRLGDRYGRRFVLQVGLVGFAVTSVLAGTAVDAEMLIGARVLQGASAALMVPQVLAMLQLDFPLTERPKAMAMYGMTFALGGLGGPLLGGVLLEADVFGLGWRSIFFVNVPIAILAVAGLAVLARESRPDGEDTFDVPGTLIATAAILAALYPLVEGRSLGWPWWLFALMAACPVLLWYFVRRESAVVARGETPLIEPGLLRHRAGIGGLLVAILFFAGTAYTLVLTVHLQTGLGFGPLHTAVSLVPFTVGVGLGSAFAPRLMPMGRIVVVAGCLVMAAGMGLILAVVATSGAELTSWQLVPGMVISGLGMAMVAGTLMTIVLATIPSAYAGGASSLINTTIQVGVAAGIAVVGSVYFARLESGRTPVDSAVTGLAIVIALYLAAAAAALVLERGHIAVDETTTEPSRA